MPAWHPDDPGFYRLLGVDPDASAEQIKRAYKRRARQLHPDHRPDDPASADEFRRLKEAYRVLSEPALRAEYDRLRAPAPTPSEPASPAPEPGPAAALGAFLRRLFGSGAQSAEDGDDLRCDLTVGLADLVAGSRILLVLPSTRARLEVSIPPGIETGTRLRLAGEGEAGLRGGRPGDLFVEITVADHPLLERRGKDLHCQVPIPLPLALFGGQVDVPGPTTSLTLEVPAGARSGQVLRMSGAGLPPQGGGPRGDLLASLQVEFPNGLEPAERQALAAALDRLDPSRFPAVDRFRRTLRSIESAPDRTGPP